MCIAHCALRAQLRLGAQDRVQGLELSPAYFSTGDLKNMGMQGHKSQILCLAFSPDSTKMVTASKDGTWRVWNINVRYHQQEDPKILLQHQQEVRLASLSGHTESH